MTAEADMTAEAEAGLRILVVEDDYLLAHALGFEIAANGDELLGPFTNIHDALGHLDKAQGAILDVELRGETSFGLADSLGQRQVPFVFLTGYDAGVVPGRFDRSCVFTKPSPGSLLIHDLHQQRRIAPPPEDLEAVVREMMALARRRMPDRESAERLVEAALLRTISESIDAPLTDNIRARLMATIEDEYRRRGKSLLH